MAQTDTKNVTFSSIVGSAAFRKGVEEFMNGVQPDYDAQRGRGRWDYERGRLYAAACAGCNERPLPNRDGRYVNRRAIRHFIDFYQDGDIR